MKTVKPVITPIPEPPKQISIAEARKRNKDVGVLITWRPNINLPEDQQYCEVRGV